MHGVKRLFAWMIPRFDRSRYNVSLISLRRKDLSADTLEEFGVDVTYLARHKFDPGTYAALLKANVTFHASLGNHDRPENVSYPPFNMNGQRYYTYVRKNVRFVALDSTLMDTKQVEWVDITLRNAREAWKIAYFHHPLCSNASRHGSSVDLRVILEPIFVRNGVNVVFSGHDHVYERIKPQKGIYYFVSGAAGQLRRGNMRPTPDTAAFFDQDQSFIAVEVAGQEMSFQAISRTGRVVDSGTIRRQSATTDTSAAR